MPFGLTNAVAVVTRLLQPIKAYLHSLGIRISLYVDDGRIVAKLKGEAEEQLQFALFIMQAAGWNIQWEKTGAEASQQLKHLGFITDTVQMKYLYPKEKEAVVEGMLEQFIGWGRAGVAVPARGWASLFGRLQDMHRSHGGIVNVMSRAGQHMLGRAVEQEGWGAEVQCTADCLRELLFLRQHLASYNGQLIGDWSVRSRVVERQEAEAEVAKVVSSRGQEQELKGEAAYVLGIDGRIKLVKETGFAEDRGRKDPVLAELKAVQGWLCAQRQALHRAGEAEWSGERSLSLWCSILRGGPRWQRCRRRW
jgi:hypothetical protein